MIVRAARIVALSAAFLSLPALAQPTHTKHKTAHHATAKHAKVAARPSHQEVKPVEVAKADPVPAPAEHPAYQSDDPEAAPTGSRRVVTHSIYSASAQ